MRKTPTIARKSKVAISEPDLLERLKRLEERVARLESETDSTATLLRSPLESRKGRMPMLEPAELLERRKGLTSWLEENWQMLAVSLRKAKSSGDAIAAMQKAKTKPHIVIQPPFYRRLEYYETALWAFLKSGRFHGNPRNLASAMAGLPELSWKRSFDCCVAIPNTVPMATQAYPDYMRRKFPDRLRELRRAGTVDEILSVLAKSKSKDPVYLILKSNPNKVREWLNLEVS